MGTQRIYASSLERTRRAPNDQEQGFALVSLIVLLPMMFAVFLSMAAGLYVLKKRALAQALCLQNGTRLQNGLKKTLDELLTLNRPAQALRKQKVAADKALKAAYVTLNPAAIAAAKAYVTAVYLQQLALRAKQEALLAQAKVQRQVAKRKLRSELAPLRSAHFSAQEFYWRSLAVKAEPATSLTPDYKPILFFKMSQQQKFGFEIDLAPPFAKNIVAGLKHKLECSVSLKGKEKQWNVEIIAANAPSK